MRAYEQNRIRRHELTRPDKENDRVRNIATLNAQTGPVLLAYRASDALRELLAVATNAAPLFSVTGPNDVVHTVWDTTPATDATLEAGLDALEALYIADGHHRSAAAARVAADRRGSPDASHEFFLAVAFPHDELRILDYNRVVRDLNGLSPEALLKRIRASFDVAELQAGHSPAQPETFAMYLAGSMVRAQDPAGARATPRSRREPRHQLAARPSACAALEDRRSTHRRAHRLRRRRARLVRARAARAVGPRRRRFRAASTRMEQLMAVADAGKLMPPKSTWFEPKLADGLLSHVLD